MNNERLIFKGQLAELQQRYDQIELKAENLFILIREKLNPIVEFEQIETDNLLTMIQEFRALQLEARDIDKKITTLKEHLGIQ